MRARPRAVPEGVTNIPREVTIQGDIRFLPFTPAAEIKRKVEGYVADLNERVIRSHGLPHTGGVDRFVIPDPIQAKAAKAAGAGADSVPMLQGVLDWSWSAVSFTGVACDMESYGYRALCDSIYEVTGQCKPFALTGSLPIIADLKEQGYDVQITGFGAFEVRTCTGMLGHAGHSRTRAVAARVWLWRTVARGLCVPLCLCSSPLRAVSRVLVLVPSRQAYHAANEFAKISGFEAGAKIVARLIDHLSAHLPTD